MRYQIPVVNEKTGERKTVVLDASTPQDGAVNAVRLAYADWGWPWSTVDSRAVVAQARKR